MANINKIKGRIGILTGGGDVPGLNPAIRGVAMRAIQEGYEVIGLRRGWAGISELIRDEQYDNSNNFIHLTKDVVSKAARTGGTFLHSSRTKASKVPKDSVPEHLKDKYNDEVNDLTPDIIENLGFLGIDTLIPIGGDDTLSYGVHLHKAGFKCVAIPKTMDNDVPGTDYCIGFSTCITRTIELSNNLRTSAGSHERIMVLEAFGRYAGFSALMPTMAGAANRCVIPEYVPNPELLTELAVYDRNNSPSKYSVIIVSEGAKLAGQDEMMFSDGKADMFGHKKLGGISDVVSNVIKTNSAKYNNGKKVETIVQRLGYMVRSGNPDAIDSLVPMAWGNLALDLILRGESGKLVGLMNGKYSSTDLEVVTSQAKVVDVEKYYNTERLRPKYLSYEGNSVFNVGTI